MAEEQIWTRRRTEDLNDKPPAEATICNEEHTEDGKHRMLSCEAIEIDLALNRRITHKFDTHIVPWLFGLWLLAFIDRSNIGNARIDGLTADLELDGDKFNIALSVFYVPYILIDVPSNWAVKHVGAGYYLPGLLIAWGTVSTCMGAVKTYRGLLAARFFLGLCEGGLLGGMVLYLSMFYRRHELLFRLGLFYCAAPLSGAFGGLLATGLAQIRLRGYNRWPWIFFVEGAISVIFGILTICFLPHTPMQAKCLTEEEKAAAVARMEVDAHGASDQSNVELERFAWRWVRMAMFNWNTVLLSFNFFAIITPIYSFSLFLPTIIRSLGYSSVKAQLFTVPPNMGGFLMVIFGTYVSDKIKMRGPIMIVGCLLAIIGYIMLLVPARPLVHYGGTFFIAAGIPSLCFIQGVFPSAPAVMAWLANNLAPHYVRATGTGLQIAIANCAAFIATFTYLQRDAPRYIAGHSINLGFLVLSVILSTTVMLYARWENGRRARGDRDHRLAEGGQGMDNYRHPEFRYTT